MQAGDPSVRRRRGKRVPVMLLPRLVSFVAVALVLLAVALGLLRNRSLSGFMEQLGLPLLILGVCSLGYGLGRDLPYRGALLEGDALRRQADAWAERHIIEPSAAEALHRCVANPAWFNLSDRRLVGHVVGRSRSRHRPAATRRPRVRPFRARSHARARRGCRRGRT